MNAPQGLEFLCCFPASTPQLPPGHRLRPCLFFCRKDGPGFLLLFSDPFQYLPETQQGQVMDQTLLGDVRIFHGREFSA